MVPTEYTDRILPGETVYLAPNGRFHRAGCRYYVAPAADAVFVEGTFTQAFLDNHCKLCFPDGVPAGAANVMAPPAAEPSFASEMPFAAAPPPMAEPASTPTAEPPPTPMAEPAPTPTPPAAEPPPLPPTITIPDEEPHRVRKRKRQRATARPMNINRVQIAAFAAIVLLSVALFVGLALLLNWFG